MIILLQDSLPLPDIPTDNPEAWLLGFTSVVLIAVISLVASLIKAWRRGEIVSYQQHKMNEDAVFIAEHAKELMEYNRALIKSMREYLENQ